MHIRVNSESIAFLNSAHVELHKINLFLKNLINSQRTVYNREVSFFNYIAYIYFKNSITNIEFLLKLCLQKAVMNLIRKVQSFKD